MPKRRQDMSHEPAGGRAAERLRQFENARLPQGNDPEETGSTLPKKRKATPGESTNEDAPEAISAPPRNK